MSEDPVPYHCYNKVIYIAGPYTGTDYFTIHRNIMQATEAAAKLANAGVGFFNPHQHSAHFEMITPQVKPAYWYDLDIHFMFSCDAILMLPGWQESKGSLKEKALMEQINRPVFYSVEDCIQWANT